MDLTEPTETAEFSEEFETAEVTAHLEPTLPDEQKQLIEEQDPVIPLRKVTKQDQPVSQYTGGVEIIDVDEEIISTPALPEAGKADSSEYFADTETSTEPVMAGKLQSMK